jgi:hypothetical protein
MKRSVAAVLGIVLAAMFALVAAPASAADPYCGIRWGSLVKSSSPGSQAPLVNVRSGRHACYDRLVLDVAGKVAGYHVGYVGTLRKDGSGFVVPVRGGAKLEVVARVPANDSRGRATYDPVNDNEALNVAGYTTFRQVAWMNSFEGHSTVGLGVRARLPFRVFVLDGPGGGSRLVVDVAHRW